MDLLGGWPCTRQKGGSRGGLARRSAVYQRERWFSGWTCQEVGRVPERKVVRGVDLPGGWPCTREKGGSRGGLARRLAVYQRERWFSGWTCQEVGPAAPRKWWAEVPLTSRVDTAFLTEGKEGRREGRKEEN